MKQNNISLLGFLGSIMFLMTLLSFGPSVICAEAQEISTDEVIKLLPQIAKVDISSLLLTGSAYGPVMFLDASMNADEQKAHLEYVKQNEEAFKKLLEICKKIAAVKDLPLSKEKYSSDDIYFKMANLMNALEIYSEYFISQNDLQGAMDSILMMEEICRLSMSIRWDNERVGTNTEESFAMRSCFPILRCCSRIYNRFDLSKAQLTTLSNGLYALENTIRNKSIQNRKDGISVVVKEVKDKETAEALHNFLKTYESLWNGYSVIKTEKALETDGKKLLAKLDKENLRDVIDYTIAMRNLVYQVRINFNTEQTMIFALLYKQKNGKYPVSVESLQQGYIPIGITSLQEPSPSEKLRDPANGTGFLKCRVDSAFTVPEAIRNMDKNRMQGWKSGGQVIEGFKVYSTGKMSMDAGGGDIPGFVIPTNYDNISAVKKIKTLYTFPKDEK